MRFGFIWEHQAVHSVRLMCKVLKVSSSGFYKWIKMRPSQRRDGEVLLLEKIRQIHEESRRTYGSPRIHAELMAQGFKASRSRVERLMKRHAITAKRKRRFKVTTNSQHSHRIAENLIERSFSAAAADEIWVSDVTFVWTTEGWLYLAIVLDLYSRRVVGWSMSDRLCPMLTCAAVWMAIKTRRPKAGLIHHSDQGKEYTCRDYQDILRAHGIRPSMSRKGDCWDNAVAESFFHTIKVELMEWQKFKTRSEARAKIFEWIEVFYNRERRHSTLGYVAPAVYERHNHVA